MNTFNEYSWLLPLLIIVVIWDLVWKGIAMWKAAKSNHKIAYVFLLILNTAGIFPIVYLLLNQKKNY